MRYTTTLIFDLMSQGARLQCPDCKDESLFGPGPGPSYPSVPEHNAMDRQQTLVGDWIGRWFVWDGVHALDVLLEQEGVDSTRVGVTGNSGGGTMAAYAVACDPRITMATPSRWITSRYHNGINEEHFDLPDVYREIQGKELRLIDSWNAAMEPAGDWGKSSPGANADESGGRDD